MKIHTQIKKILADTKTPVSIYLALRDKYTKPLLLESSDYSSKEGHYSYICLNPIAEISIQNDFIIQKTSTEYKSEKTVSTENTLDELEKFRQKFEFDHLNLKFCYAGLFGFSSYNAISYFEEIELKNKKELDIPELYYGLYSIILVFDHNTDSLHIISHAFTNEESISQLTEVEQNLEFSKYSPYPFDLIGETNVNVSDEEFISLVEQAKNQCKIGNVFQLVLSKRFTQKFKGDEFNVYRALRNLNPSPYLFYFDLGDFKFFGSSPEAQLVIEKNIAEIHPIAGTYKRTGNDLQDAEKAKELLGDAKEESEHMMLVDLARNDLSKFCKNVTVRFLKQVQFYSHVIHLVSKVTGELRINCRPFDILLGTFPAGTLSGAPKHRAMQLIDEYETCAREFYGGCVGFISHDNNLNHAIMIRTAVSKDYTLTYQAGAGIVITSNSINENEEIYNKISALKKAMQLAEKFNNITKSNTHEIISTR